MLPWSVSILECIQGLLLFFFFTTIFFKGLFLFFWDRVSRLVLNSQYPWLSLISVGITYELSFWKGSSSWGNPSLCWIFPHLLCSGSGLSPFHCLFEVDISTNDEFGPKISHTHAHAKKRNKKTKPQNHRDSGSFMSFCATWGPLFSVLRRWLAPSVFPPLVTPNFPSSSHHFVIGPTRWQDPFNF